MTIQNFEASVVAKHKDGPLVKAHVDPTTVLLSSRVDEKVYSLFNIGGCAQECIEGNCRLSLSYVLH